MPLEIGQVPILEGTNLYIEQGVAWSGKLSLVDEVMVLRDGKPVLGGIKAYAQLFRLEDIQGWDFSVHIGNVNSYKDLIDHIEARADRIVNHKEIVTIVTLRLTKAQAKLVNQKENLK